MDRIRHILGFSDKGILTAAELSTPVTDVS